MTVLRSSLNEIYAPIQTELELFAKALQKELASDDKLISDIHGHLLKMSGKFLRPALALLAAKTGPDPFKPQAVSMAVVIELIHTATLVHDDIIDDSELRRNQPSVYFKWGREISIVSGDYLYAKAFLLLAGLKDVWVNQVFAHCAHVMCEGEMKQIERRNNFLMGEEEYLKIIHQKTAALFQAACMGGAYLAGAAAPTINKLGDYGFRLGMAFQIVDDCLDLIGETESLGKTTGLDIDKNDVTLPLLYLFQDLSGPERKDLLLQFQNANGELFGKIRDLAVKKKSVERAMDKARQYIEKSVEDISDLAPSVYKESLTQLAFYCLERVR